MISVRRKVRLTTRQPTLSGQLGFRRQDGKLATRHKKAKKEAGGSHAGTYAAAIAQSFAFPGLRPPWAFLSKTDGPFFHVFLAPPSRVPPPHHRAPVRLSIRVNKRPPRLRCMRAFFDGWHLGGHLLILVSKSDKQLELERNTF